MTISEFDIRVAKLRKKLLDELEQNVSPELEELAALEEPDDTPAPATSSRASEGSGTVIQNMGLGLDNIPNTGINVANWSASTPLIPSPTYGRNAFEKVGLHNPIMNGLPATIRSDLFGTRSATISVRGHEVILDFPNAGDANRIADSLSSDVHPTIVFDTDPPDTEE
ncbi:hypothetical protein [Arthrobacter sp. SAFR-014]|uniref:hypothetical protein n=1 Tax=unclassified Arthrobacter TaxID=235627 RepID=UPI003F7BF6BA